MSSNIFSDVVFCIHFKAANQKPINFCAIMITSGVFFSLFLQSKIDTFSGQALSNIVQIPKNVQPDKNTAKALLRILDKTVKTFNKTRNHWCTRYI